MILKRDYKRIWAIDNTGLVRHDSKIYILLDEAIRSELIKINHNNPWQNNYTSRDKTIETLTRYY